MDVIAHLETIEAELTEVRRRLDQLYNQVETTGLDMAEVTPRIPGRPVDALRTEVTLDDVEAITAYAQDMSEFLKTSELTESRAFVESFVKEIVVSPGKAAIRYTIPMPEG